MANQEHVDRLLQGVEAWNQWREENPEIEPDLRNANLSDAKLGLTNLRGTDLSDINLRIANFSGANFRNANLSGVILSQAILSRTDFSYADLTNSKFSGSNLEFANLKCANLKDASFTGVNLYQTILEDANLSGAKLNLTNISRANLSRTNLEGAKLSGAYLEFANLSGAHLKGAGLGGAHLSGANLSGANLEDACLSGVQALNTILQTANLTGASVADWNINAHTNLQDVVCEYIFTGYNREDKQFTDRRPHDPNQIFAPGEFTKRYQIVLESVDLFFNDGIDWKAFLASLQDLKTQYGDELNLQGIEKKAGGSFVVRLEVPSDVDKGAVERDVKALYETNLEVLEAKYHTELQAKDREIEIYKQKSADILELAKLAAGRPIHVEAKAVAENQSSSESYTNNFSNATIGNFANKMQDQASQQTNQYIGANLNEINTLIRSLRGKAESFPEAQRTEAIDHLTDLETDLQQPPEKRKLSRIKATLLALVGIATVVSGAVASTNEFVGQVQELSDKLGIELPIEQLQPQPPDAIDVKAIGSDRS